MAKTGIRRDSKHRVLRRGESIRWDGKYQFKYHVNGKAHFVYSWRLEPTDKLPAGKKPCLSLRELEKQIGYRISCGIGIHTGEISLSKVGMRGKEQREHSENEFGIAWIGNSTTLACKQSSAVECACK